MSQRYIFLRMASGRDPRDERSWHHHHARHPRLQRHAFSPSHARAPVRCLSSASLTLPPSRSYRAHSLQHYYRRAPSPSAVLHAPPPQQQQLPPQSASGLPYEPSPRSLISPLAGSSLSAPTLVTGDSDGDDLQTSKDGGDSDRYGHEYGYYAQAWGSAHDGLSGMEAWTPRTSTSDHDGEPTLLIDDVNQEAEDQEQLQAGRCRLSKEVMFGVAALVALATSGGLILGFGPVYSTLVRDQQWSELCGSPSSIVEGVTRTTTTTTCAPQEVHLQYVFATGFLCLSAANAFFGVFLDVAGPRMTALLGLAMSLCGNAALARGDSHAGTGHWILIGYALVGAGGMGSYLAAFQILQLFDAQGLVCSALSSLFNCSGYIYMLLQVRGISRAAFFHAYGYIVLVCMVLCFVLFPTNNIIRPRDFMAIPGLRLEAPRLMNPFGLVERLQHELRRPDLWFFAVYFGWLSLVFAFAGGAIPRMLTTLAVANDRADDAALFINVLFPVLVNGTFIYSPLVGYIIDHFGFKVIFVAGLALVQIVTVMLLLPSLEMQIITFLLYAMAQASIYALQFAYIMMCFPPELYGTLQAFLAIVSFVFGLLNYALNPWTQSYLAGNYSVMLVLLVGPTVALYPFIQFVQDFEGHVSTGALDKDMHSMHSFVDHDIEDEQTLKQQKDATYKTTQRPTEHSKLLI